MSTTEVVIAGEVVGHAPVISYEQPQLPVAGIQTQQANLLEVDDEQTMNLVIDAARTLKQRRDAIEAKRMEFAKPLNDLKTAIQNNFNPVLADYDAAIGICKSKVITFQRAEQERVRLEQAAAEKARKDAAAAAEKAAKAAERKGDTDKADALRENAAVMPAPYVPPPAAISGGSGLTGRWKARVVDPAAALAWAAANNPNLFKFDQSAGDSAARSRKGPSNIPGIEFYEDTGLTLRG